MTLLNRRVSETFCRLDAAVADALSRLPTNIEETLRLRVDESWLRARGIDYTVNTWTNEDTRARYLRRVFSYARRLLLTPRMRRMRQTLRWINAQDPCYAIHRFVDLAGRGAAELAELDRAFDVLPRSKLLRFVDLCSAPGGFVDYIGLRKKWSSVGVCVTQSEDRGGSKMCESLRLPTLAPVPLLRCDVRECSTLASARPSKHAPVRTPRFVSLVLADGPSHAEVIRGEWRIARSVLQRGGTFLLKSSWWCRDVRILTTICEIVRHFASASVAQPRQTRCGSGQRYLLLRSFNGCTGTSRCAACAAKSNLCTTADRRLRTLTRDFGRECALLLHAEGALVWQRHSLLHALARHDREAAVGLAVNGVKRAADADLRLQLRERYIRETLRLPRRYVVSTSTSPGSSA